MYYHLVVQTSKYTHYNAQWRFEKLQPYKDSAERLEAELLRKQQEIKVHHACEGWIRDSLRRTLLVLSVPVFA